MAGTPRRGGRADEEEGLLSQDANARPAEAVRHAPKRIAGMPVAVFAGLCYCAASGSMVLLNKHALASFQFTAPNALLCFQCVLSVVMVKLCELAGLVQLQPLKWDLVRVWFPVNLIFVGMIGTSFYALAAVGVGMVTVWKNVSNFLTAVGDVTLFGKSYTAQVWLTLCLMLASAVVGASTDARFSWSGYSWQILNCVFTSAYALYLRNTMDRVAEYTTHKSKMDEFSMVFYNNLLSVPPILGLMWAFGEFPRLGSQPALANPAFLCVATASGLIGFAISFFSLWCAKPRHASRRVSGAWEDSRSGAPCAATGGGGGGIQALDKGLACCHRLMGRTNLLSPHPTPCSQPLSQLTPPSVR